MRRDEEVWTEGIGGRIVTGVGTNEVMIPTSYGLAAIAFRVLVCFLLPV